jgi:uncharacterized membrane protein
MSTWQDEGAARAAPPILGHVAYGLMAIGLLTAVSAALGAVIAYAAKRDRGTIRSDDWLASHWDHIVLVFFYGLAGFVLASAVTVLLGWIPVLGWLIAAVAWVAFFAWYAYQVLRGWLAFGQARPVTPSEQAWLIL